MRDLHFGVQEDVTIDSHTSTSMSPWTFSVSSTLKETLRIVFAKGV